MRPSEFEAIRPHLKRAVDDIDYFLNGEKEWEKAKRELFELYDLMVADKTPPEVKGRGKHRLTKTQYNALVHGTSVYGNPLTDKKREAILAKLGPGEPLSDAGRKALEFWARGGWRESSRQAAVWLRNAGETVAADGIDVTLSRLPDEPREATELPGYREAMRTAAGHVRTILTTCLEEQPPAAKSTDGKDGGGKRGRKKANYETVQREAKLAADWVRARDSGGYKPDFAKEQGMTTPDFDRLLQRVASRKTDSE